MLTLKRTLWLWTLLVAVPMLSALTPSPAQARELFSEGEYRLELRSAFKGSWLLSIPPGDPLLPNAGDPATTGLFRLRFDMNANLSEYFTVAAAYEHRARMSSSAISGAALLPPAAQTPFRLTALDWAIVDDAPQFSHRHELDRAYVSLHLPFGELTVGRQPIGLGRGVLFSAVELFAPFSPTEIDREWRRGVDAVHLELRIPDLNALSADIIAVFGTDIESSSLVGRVRAVVGDLDGSVLVGRRAEDNVVGATLSATVGDAEVHAEGSLFGTDGRGIDGGFLGTDRVVAKALLGGSYMFNIGAGLRIVAEYHYSGFGVRNIGRDPSILADPAFGARFLRGDSQLFGRHAIALVLSYDLFDDLSGAISYLQSPIDASGLITPTLSWNFSDNVTIVGSAFIPWGSGPQGGVPTSEWGSSPITVFLQARIYD